MEIQKHNLEKIGKFCDTKTIVVPNSLNDLIEQLHEVFAEDHVNVEYVQKLMEMYTSNRKEWKKFAKFDKHR